MPNAQFPGSKKKKWGRWLGGGGVEQNACCLPADRRCSTQTLARASWHFDIALWYSEGLILPVWGMKGTLSPTKVDEPSFGANGSPTPFCGFETANRTTVLFEQFRTQLITCSISRVQVDSAENGTRPRPPHDVPSGHWLTRPCTITCVCFGLLQPVPRAVLRVSASRRSRLGPLTCPLTCQPRCRWTPKALCSK